jgi:hypothetical protein
LSRSVRSLEKRPIAATLRIEIACHGSGWAWVATARSCVSQYASKAAQCRYA